MIVYCCNTCTPSSKILFLFSALEPPLLRITSGSNWLYMKWTAQSATFRVLYRESGAPDHQVIVSATSQLSHNISALQPNTLYNIVVEATHTALQQKVNSSVTESYTTPHGELDDIDVSSPVPVVLLRQTWKLANWTHKSQDAFISCTTRVLLHILCETSTQCLYKLTYMIIYHM